VITQEYVFCTIHPTSPYILVEGLPVGYPWSCDPNVTAERQWGRITGTVDGFIGNLI
jgi:hypothetical protein